MKTIIQTPPGDCEIPVTKAMSGALITEPLIKFSHGKPSHTNLCTYKNMEFNIRVYVHACTSSKPCLLHHYNILGSRILIVGNRGRIDINPRALMFPEASITGVALGASTQDQIKRMGRALEAGIQAGKIC